MTFDAILEYQAADLEQLALEKEVKTSKQHKDLEEITKTVSEANGKILSLSGEAEGLLGAYSKIKAQSEELKAKLDELENYVAEVADLTEVEYYVKQIDAVSGKLSALEREASRDLSRIDNLDEQFKKTWKQGMDANRKLTQIKAEYGAYLQGIRPKAEAVQKKMAELRPQIDKGIMESYMFLRKTQAPPVFVEYDSKENRCGRCRIEMPNDIRTKIRTQGYMECPSCHRIMYFK